MTQNVPIEKYSFLIIDSNNHMASTTKNILRSLGAMKVRSAGDASTALEQLENGSCDLVILDLDFNDCLDGLELARMVRTSDGGPKAHIPIIMLCSRPEKSRVLAARDAGIHEFLRRPFSAAELHQRVSAALNRPRAFVKAPDYLGPDRRRTANNDYKGPDRRTLRQDEKAGEVHDVAAE
jgi:DNA-binding response OmpR family regulator